MTCIVGVVSEGTVWIGGDSSASAGCERYPASPDEQKVIRRGEMVLGATGPIRMLQILRYALDIPEHPEDMETFAYLVTLLMPALKTAIDDHGGVKINEEAEGWEFLLGYRGTLYSICHDLSVNHLPMYASVGCGHMIALGSLYTTGVRGPFEPRARLLLSLDAAAQHDIHVAAPFQIEEVG